MMLTFFFLLSQSIADNKYKAPDITGENKSPYPSTVSIIYPIPKSNKIIKAKEI